MTLEGGRGESLREFRESVPGMETFEPHLEEEFDGQKRGTVLAR